MNQILYTGGKNRKNGTSSMQKTIIIFVVFLIMFAICLIVIGMNLFGKVKDVANTNPTPNTPPNTQGEEPGNQEEPPVEEAEVTIAFESENQELENKKIREVKITAKSDNDIKIKNISYWWDDEEAKTIEVSNIICEVETKSKNEQQRLHVKVTDENGNIKTGDEANIDITFSSELNGVKIQAVGIEETIIQNISYWWDDEEAENEDVFETEYETVISSKQGRHTLYVEVTDENNNKHTVKQLVIGDSGPEEVKISTDGVSNYVIKSKDNTGIERIVIVLNGETQEVKFEDTPEEIEYKVPIPQGYSLIDVTVYNVNGLSTNAKAKINDYRG